jgi:hypothetical protein
MPTAAPVADDGFLYDAELTSIDAPGELLRFQVAGTEYTVKYPEPAYWEVGCVGRLRLESPRQRFAFHLYFDQRLRRAPEFDDPRGHQWGWRIDERHFLIRAGLIPGRDGQVVRQKTKRLVLQVPSEFIFFCTSRGLKPESILRAFIADLCEIHNWANCPREDDYGSNGSDERMYANAYFERCFGWVNDPEYRRSLKATATGATDVG